jgi:hypothetical protein
VAPVLLAAGAVAFFLLRGGDNQPGTAKGNKPSEEAPPFDFTLKGAIPITTVGGDRQAARGAADEAAREVQDTLSRMFGLAFLDPKNWRPGDYDSVMDFFEAGQAQAAATKDEATLTLGPDAGAQFEKVVPAKGTLKVKVLLDREGSPFTAEARTRFVARATGKDGEVIDVRSSGHYFMRPGEEGWTIFAYKVKRTDAGEGAPESPEPTGTASG